VIALGAYLGLIETLSVGQRRSSSPLGIARGFLSVMQDRIYIGLMIFGAAQIAGLFGYLNTVSFLYQDTFGLGQAEFGIWFAFNAVASYLGVQLGTYLAKYLQGQWMLLVYGLVGVLAGVLMMFTAPMGSVWMAEALFVLQFLAFGAGLTTIPTFALLNHGTEAGTAASLLGVMNFTTTAALAGVYAMLRTTDTFDVGVLVAALNLVSVLSLVFVVRPWTIPDLRSKKRITN
jgi:DHA1 family bicyclomycin/chloramphenicol resistance-like MFS transporter